MNFDDLAPYDVQDCKDKLHQIIFGQIALNVVGRLDKVSDLQAAFITF